MSWTFMQSFNFIPFLAILASEKKIFEYFFRQFSLSIAMETNQNQRFWQIHMVGRGQLQKIFVKRLSKYLQ